VAPAPLPRLGAEGTSMTDTTIDEAEVKKFTAMAEDWWDPTGKFKPLHAINPVRLQVIRDAALAHFKRDTRVRRPFEGLSLLDIGCGGGLASEPMARLGFTVTGIDVVDRNLAIAKLHTEQSGLSIDYRLGTVEALAAAGERFDVILNLEVVEHVDNVPLYLRSCAALLAPGGLMVSSTINRTARALALAVIGAEYVLRWLPRGTHDWNKFLTPEELTTLLERNGLDVTTRTGVVYNPLADAWRQSSDMSVNYMLVASKPTTTLG
jgi:2-polyprenyl-6-hydroxyphenyl methylase/3-demethylubiquinone-9 3-methyltransferase